MANQRRQLSRELIAQTALALLDEGEGLSSLSMRKLGAELGVEAMSLYHYVDNRSDLLDAVLTLVFARIELPTYEDGVWEDPLRAGARSVNDLLTSSRSAFELVTMQPASSAESLAVMFFGSTVFNRAGITMRDSINALHVAMAFVIGHVAVRDGAIAGVANGADLDDALMANVEISEFVRDANSITREEQFETGLDVVIAGLKARYDLP